MDYRRFGAARINHSSRVAHRNLNRALAFAKMAVLASGELKTAQKATTLSEAQRRAADLRVDLAGRGVHCGPLGDG